MYGKPSGLMTSKAHAWIFVTPSQYVFIEREKIKDCIIENNLQFVNFVGNVKSVIGFKPFPITFDDRLVGELDFERLQEKLDVPIIIKLKSRSDEGNEQVARNKSYIKSIMPDVNYSVITDADNDELICNSKLVISCPGTFALKSIQLGIPTVLIEGSNEDGHFPLFQGICTTFKNVNKK